MSFVSFSFSAPLDLVSHSVAFAPVVQVHWDSASAFYLTNLAGTLNVPVFNSWLHSSACRILAANSSGSMAQ